MLREMETIFTETIQTTHAQKQQHYSTGLHRLRLNFQYEYITEKLGPPAHIP